jgi:alpha-beta hydrolase superfamily lysophospholipase
MPGADAPRPFRVATGDGLELAGESHLPAAAAPLRAHLLLVHGFAEHRKRYRGLAGELAGAGYAVHLFDLRGHGESGGRRGHVERFADYRGDLARVAAAVLPAPDEAGAGPPAVLLGHSLGGLIALDAVLRRPEPFRGLALSSPFLASAFRLPPFVRAVAGATARLLPEADFPAALDPEGLSRDPEVVRRYREDPLVLRRLTAAWLGAVLDAQAEVFERAGEYRLPVLLLLGSADPIAEPARGRALFVRLGSPVKRLEVYDDYRHEVFNELGRERVVADLLDWLSRAAPGPSGAGEPIPPPTP